jgi:multisubunit Na+/H+ antiporter MnhG subunit
MEKFELTVVAQGSQSIWVAVLVIALLCLTIVAVAVSHAVAKSSQRMGRMQRRPRN